MKKLYRYSRLEDELVKASIKEHGPAQGCRVAQSQIFQRCNIKRSLKSIEQRWYKMKNPKPKTKPTPKPTPKSTGGKNVDLVNTIVLQVVNSLSYEQKKELINKYI